MISGLNKVLVGWFGSRMDLISTFKQSRGIRIRFELSAVVLAKATTFLMAVRCTVFEVAVEAVDDF
jgi:hypothetical protein